MVSRTINKILGCALAATCLLPSVAFCADVEPSEYESLLNVANEKGVVPVLVSIDSIPLDSIKNNSSKVRNEVSKKVKVLLTELGENVLDVGQWNNGMGQIGVYVTPDGLNILTESDNAENFRPDDTRSSRIQVSNVDGSLEAIEADIENTGYSYVEVLLNVDDFEYDIDKRGITKFKAGKSLKEQVKTSLKRVKEKAHAKGFRELDDSPSQAANPKPSFLVKIDRKAFNGLKEDKDVRAIRPVGFVDSRQAQWPPEVLKYAEENGATELIITIRGGEPFSPKTGNMSAKALEHQAAANQRVLDDVLTSAGVSLVSSSLGDYLGYGSIHLQLNHEELVSLYEKKDPRVLSVNLNKPSASASLNNSTQLMNMQSAWNAGYQADGQTIVVLDTGIRKDHGLFMVNGVSKVTYEACFGTNQGSFSSDCPQQNSAGDSPLGLVGSAGPHTDTTYCATHSATCAHGSHVAGIAAGHASNDVYSSLFQGVAPGANIISGKVFSFSSTEATAHNADILAALNAVNSATGTGVENPFVVNMSIGNPLFFYSGNCRSVDVSITNAISALTSKGVPVVISTGNESHKTGIAWPACIPGAIKVSSVKNDSAGNIVPNYANIGTPANYTGQFLLAPGGGDKDERPVFSAVDDSTTEVGGISGTSMAAPHVAGLYAAVKAVVPGISVADASAWIASHGSIAQTHTFPDPTGTQTYHRVRVPNF